MTFFSSVILQYRYRVHGTTERRHWCFVQKKDNISLITQKHLKMVTQIKAIRKVGSDGRLNFFESKTAAPDCQQSASKEHIYNRTKEIAQEHACAKDGAKLIRKAFAVIMCEVKDLFIARRLVHEMGAVIKTDTSNPHGLRTIADGDIELLQGFNVNTDLDLKNVFKAPFTASIDRSNSSMQVDFPSVINPLLIQKPKKASHFRLTIAGASIDFRTGNYLCVAETGEHLLLGNKSTTAPTLHVQLPPEGSAPLLLALGISFFREVDGQFQGIGKGQYNAVAIVAVSGSQALKIAA